MRIYPAKGCDIYDNFFLGPRPFNRAVYRALFTDDILKCGPIIQPSANTIVKNSEAKQDSNQSQSAYENYKKQQQEKTEIKRLEEQQNLKKH